MINRAAGIICAGGVVAFPTETVYGLGANALDPVAIHKIYQIKKRPATSPLIVHVNSVNMARGLVIEWPESAGKLAAAFWPGPLTLVLPKSDRVPAELTAGLDTVGLRMPSHPMALALITAAGVPIAAPSANLFTQLSPTSAQHVRDSLGDAVDMILDGGPTDIGIESTVLSLATNPPVLLRPGMITRAQIEAQIGPVETIETSQSESAPHASPGLHAKHYAPRTPLYLLDYTQPFPGLGRGVYLHHSHGRPGVSCRRMPSNPSDYAAVLYDTLHELDRAGFDWIAIEPPPLDPKWDGIVDRLVRASVR